MKIGEDVRSTDFTRRVVPTGGSIDRVGSPRRATAKPAARADDEPAAPGPVAVAAEATGARRAPRLTDPGPAGDLADLG